MITPNAEVEQKYQRLFKDGKLVQVHVSKWGMGYTTRTKENELEKDLPDFYKPGKRMLIPDETRLAFQRLETQARMYLHANSLQYQAYDSHFVPRKKLVEVMLTLAKMKRDYYKLVDEFIANYEQYKQEMLDKYPEHREILEPYYPPADKVRQKFSFSVSMYQAAFPDLDTVSMADLLAQNDAVEELKEEFKAQMEDQRQQALSNMEGFVAESIKLLRGQIVEVFETITAKIQNREVISKTNIKSIQAVIQDFQGLDFFNDKEVQAKLKDVQALLRQDLDFKDNHKAILRLQATLGEALTAARNMSDVNALTGGYFRNIDMGDGLGETTQPATPAPSA